MLFALVLWAGFRALGAAIVLLLFAIPAVQLHIERLDLSGISSAIGGCVVLIALRPRFAPKKEKGDDGGPKPLGTSIPALRTFVDDVATRCGARKPHEIVLAEGATAYITQERSWLGLKRKITVGLGLPLFAMLDRDELASVLAHELGHHRRGDLSLGPWIYRTRLGLASAIESLDDSAFFLDAPFRAYGRLFVRATAAVSRQQELDADAHAASVCGAEATCRALETVHRLSPLWDAYFLLDVIPTINLGARIPIFDGFRRFLVAPRRRPEVTGLIDAEKVRKPAIWDSHPPLRERVEAISGLPEREGDALGSRSCLDLVGGEAALETAWYARATRGKLQAIGWDDVGSTLLLPAMRERLQGSPLDPSRGSAEDLPRHLKDPAVLWDSVARGVIGILSPATRRKNGLILVEDWLTAVLARSGFTLVREPAGPIVLRRGALEVEPGEIVDGVASGRIGEAVYLESCRAWAA